MPTPVGSKMISKEKLIHMYRGALVLRTLLKRANLKLGLESVEELLHSLEEIEPNLPQLSALRKVTDDTTTG